ncbi:hypothetical protein ACFPC0_04400 [Streptomyces andamanensis]|uniref:Uncharacterized protein n=1 Tax=Streptomyces andamanensis TaxID=1565035 RepID=A0ABV8T923_9ACTN
MIDFARNVRLWFAPEEVREEGRTPDYRFSLANERTNSPRSWGCRARR